MKQEGHIDKSVFLRYYPYLGFLAGFRHLYNWIIATEKRSRQVYMAFILRENIHLA
jgi:hypothetical protein